MAATGEVPFPLDSAERSAAAAELAAILAEHGVQRITIADPRVCAMREVRARETDLPRVILEAEPGTTLSLGEVGLMIDTEAIRWACAEESHPLARALAAWGSDRRS